MSEAGSSAFSRECPSCGRRVPTKVTQCRCGAQMPAEPNALAARDDAEPSTADFAAGVRFGLIVALGLGVVAGGAYLISRPAPAPARPVPATSKLFPVEPAPRELAVSEAVLPAATPAPE